MGSFGRLGKAAERHVSTLADRVLADVHFETVALAGEVAVFQDQLADRCVARGQR
jgi:hypothetical protein